MTQPNSLAPVLHIEPCILLIRGQKVMIDADLAELYGAPTKRLNEQVKRNRERFPRDFMFQLTAEEKAEVVANCDHLNKLKFSRTLPFVFTEHGAMMAGFMLNSPHAVEMSIYVVRAFVRLREVLASNRDLANRLNDLEEKTEAQALQHDTFAHNTRTQLKQVFEAIRQLMTPPDPPKRPIGIVTEETPSKAAKEKD